MAKTFIPTDAIIQQIVKAHYLNKVKLINHLEGGYSSPVVNVNNEYVIKLNKGNKPLHLEKLTREAYLYNLLKDNKIPTPKVIALDTTKQIVPYYYLIIEYLKGNTLQNQYPLLSNKNNLTEQLGQIVKKIHSIKFDHSDSIINNKTNWKACILESFNSHYENFNHNNASLSDVQKEQINQIHHDFTNKINETEMSRSRFFRHMN